MLSEIERYKIGQAKDWLRSVAAASQEVDILKQQRDEIVADASGVSGIDYSAIKAHSIATDDQIPNALARIDKLTSKLDASIAESTDQIAQACNAVDRIESTSERNVLRLRYLMGGLMPWREVGKRMGYSSSSVKRTHTYALLDLYDLMPNGTKDRIPSAI